MATPSIDYAALADQARKSGTVDYAALAAKARGGAPTEQKGFASSFADSSGLTAISPPHLLDTIMGIPAGLKKMAADSVANVKQGVADYQKEGLSETTRRDFGRAVPIVGPALAQAQAQHDAGNNAGMAGTLAGTVAGLAAPEAIKGIKPAAIAEKVAPAVRTVGEAAEAAGNKLLNETVGSYNKDFNRGANPGRGYNETIGRPSLSMRSLAEKAEAVKDQTGEAIGKVIQDSAAKNELIPINNVIEALQKPLKEQYDLERGPGGLGNTAPYESYAQGFKDIIQKGVKNGGLTSQELFDLKKSIAKRAKWNNTTPEGIMDVRQQQVGALGGLLTDAIPELKNLNRNYQDLVGLADRAAWRAESGAKPFGSLVREGAKATGAVGAGLTHDPAALAAAGAIYAADTVPGRTAIATGLYRAGKGLSSLADRFEGPAADPVIEQAASPQIVRPKFNEPLQEYIRRKKAARGN
jgi:hypothetical protein